MFLVVMSVFGWVFNKTSLPIKKKNVLLLEIYSPSSQPFSGPYTGIIELKWIESGYVEKVYFS